MLTESELLARLNNPDVFNAHNGITILSAQPDGTAEGVLNVTQSSHNPHGTVHGGCLYTLADTVAGTAACAHGASCVTVNGTMEFLRPATGPTIRCAASPKKQGSTLSVMQVVLTNAEGKEVATGTFTFFMMPLGKD